MSYRTRAPYLDSDVFFCSHGVTEKHEKPSTAPLREIALLPVGCVEQHGPYLPVQTDSILAEGLAHHLVARLANEGYLVRAFPPIHFTPTQTNTDFGDTVSVSADVFAAYTEEVCRSLMSQSFDALIIVNGHGPAEFRLKEIAFKLVHEQFSQKKSKIKPAFVISGYEFDAPLGRLLDLKPGRHADWREFLSLFFLLGPSYFTADLLRNMKSFQAENDFTVPTSSILGIPMQFRSVDGVQGDPFPFEPEQVPALSAKVWDFIVEGAAAKVISELGHFGSWKNIFGNQNGRTP